MRFTVQKLFLQLFFLFAAISAGAQQTWPSPEVEAMYHNAQQYENTGNYKDAIATYKQAIILSPANLVLYRDLGHALYASGNYAEAEQVLTPLINKADADVSCYYLLAAAQAARQDTKHAKETLKNGVGRFPVSGILYHELSIVYTLEHKPHDALNALMDGIDRAPAYSDNYCDAALVYMHSGHVVFGIIYAEQYMLMAEDTAKNEVVKQALFTGYKTMFDNIAKQAMTEYGKTKKTVATKTFEEAVLSIYTTLTPVISDGITTENLTMVRTRFLMDWFTGYDKIYPFTLFSYQDQLLRSGHFDMYSEWLFGKAESGTEYNAWNKFHEGDMSRFLQWMQTNRYSIAPHENYNDRSMEGMFKKGK